MKISEINIVRAYSRSPSSQEVKKFNGIAQELLLINRAKDSQKDPNNMFKAVPKYIVLKTLFEMVPEKFTIEYCAKNLTEENLDEVLAFLHTDYKTQETPVIHILENAFDEFTDISKEDGIKYFLKQYFDIQSDITDISQLSENDFKIVMMNLMKTHHQLPISLQINLESCINEPFIEIFNENNPNGKGENEIKEILDKTEIVYPCKSLKIVPLTIFNCKNLKRLNLSWNQLAFIPLEIGNLKNLQELDFSENKLKSLPSGITQLKSLEYLKLSNNQSLGDLSKEYNNRIAIESFFEMLNKESK